MGLRHLKTPHTPFYQNQREQKFPSPPNPNIYIFFLKKMFFFLKALSVKVNVEGGLGHSLLHSPSLWASLVHPQQRTRPQGERTRRSEGWGLPQPISSQSGCRRGARKATPRWSFPSGTGSGEAAFLCSPQPVPSQVEAGSAGGQAGCRRETQDLLGPCGQGEPRFLSSWTKASMISSFTFCSSFLTSSRSSCFTLSNSDSSPELDVTG